MNMFAALTGKTHSHRLELAPAKAAIERYGYEASYDDQGNVIVQDPVHSSRGGRLVLTGYEPVVIRSYDAARAFINVRN